MQKNVKVALFLGGAAGLTGLGLLIYNATKSEAAPKPGGGTRYTLTVNAYPAAGGSVTRTPNKSLYDEGELIVLQATPKTDTGYRFDHWELDGKWFEDANPINFIVMADHAITAVFQATTASPGQYTLTFAVSPSAAGSIIRTPSGPTYPQGTLVALRAAVNPGYVFDHWELDGKWFENANPISFIVMANHAITAIYTAPPVQYTLTVGASPAATGSVFITPAKQQYASGEMVTIEAEPAAGYRFDRWEFDGQWFTDVNMVTFPVGANHAFVAYFVPFIPL